MSISQTHMYCLLFQNYREGQSSRNGQGMKQWNIYIVHVDLFLN